MDLEVVIYEKKDHIAYVTMNRPEARNSMNGRMHIDLAQVWKDVRGDAKIWAVVLTGAGNEAFCAGRDVKELSAHQQEGKLVGRYDPAAAEAGVFGWPHLYNVWKPIVAAINGFVVGGGLGLLQDCDLRVMSEKAWVGDLHVNIAQLGGPWKLAQSFPYPVACELALMGNRITAQRAYELGFVNKVVPPEDLMAEATKMAERLCEMGPLAVQRSKEVMRMYLTPPTAVMQLDEHYAAEMRLTEDGKEGPKAFKEKRKPVWTGR